MIPQKNLSLLSNNLASQGGRRIPEAVLERDYCISWFLIGLSNSLLKNVFLFKGGTAIKKCYIKDYRFSEDLDFTLIKEVDFEYIKRNLKEVCEYVYKNSGIKIKFSREDKILHKNSYTLYLAYEGPLPGTFKKEVKVDITIQEKIVFPAEEKVILKYKEYSDISDEINIDVYSINEIASEKIVALLDKARNEPKDLYDLWCLIDNKYVDIFDLPDAVIQKLEFRKKDLDNVKGEFLIKEKRIKLLWEKRLSKQMAILPEFDNAYRVIKRAFRQVGIT